MKSSVIKCLGVWSVAVGLLLSCTGTGTEATYRSLRGGVWGTYYNITYKSSSDLENVAVECMHRVDTVLSPFVEGSLVSRINAGARVAADSMFRQVFDLSCHVCSVSGGMFDPTVAPIVNLYGFGYRDTPGTLPDAAAIDSALATVGILDCRILPDGTVVKKTPGTEFNFSAVAKGYGVDCVARALRSSGCTDYMVEIGGEIALAGKNSRGVPWVIQVDAPLDDLAGTNHTPVVYLQLTDMAIATSGNYRNYRDTPQGRVSHTISPLTGLPVQTATLSATVIAPTCALADALATACMAMDADAAMTMIEGIPQSECLLVLAGPAQSEPEFTTRLSSGFTRYIRR